MFVKLGYGLPAMPGSLGMVRQGLHMEDDGGGAKLQGVAAGDVDLSGVWEGLSKGVTGVAPPNP